MFFASLKSEEAEAITCRIAWLDRDEAEQRSSGLSVANRWKCFRLGSSVSLTVRNLVKLSKAVDPWTSTLAVDQEEDGALRIWGLIDQSIHHSVYLAHEGGVSPEMPGLFQAVIQGVGEVTAYKAHVFLGSLKQDTLFTKQQRVFQSGPIHAKLLASVEQFRQHVRKRVTASMYSPQDHWDEVLEGLWMSTLCRILIGIQRYHHGGAVLISDIGKQLKPKYSLDYPRLHTSLVDFAVESIRNVFVAEQIGNEIAEEESAQISASLYNQESKSVQSLRERMAEVTGCVRFLTSLSRVDGLVWLDNRLALRGFGVEVKTTHDPEEVARATDSVGKVTRKLNLEQFGMRHRSVVRACATDPDSVGFVISQDGDVRATTTAQNRVLMWENIKIQSIRNARRIPED
jgi:hypothetical protein